MLKLPDYSKQFRIDLAADASNIAIGAELSQNRQPVVFYSKNLTPTEARYHITDLELLAIYQACISGGSTFTGIDALSTLIISRVSIYTCNYILKPAKPDGWSA